VNTILALVGHGGLTVTGLNTLVLGAVAATAHGCFRSLARRLRPAWAMALASAAGQLVGGVLWFALVWLAVRSNRGHLATLTSGTPRLELLGAVSLIVWIAGSLIESIVAFGLGRFLARVHPALLPVPERAGVDAAAAGTS
jgi:ABC-type Co2+ transport system permease subunit